MGEMNLRTEGHFIWNICFAETDIVSAAVAATSAPPATRGRGGRGRGGRGRGGRGGRGGKAGREPKPPRYVGNEWPMIVSYVTTVVSDVLWLDYQKWKPQDSVDILQTRCQ